MSAIAIFEPDVMNFFMPYSIVGCTTAATICTVSSRVFDSFGANFLASTPGAYTGSIVGLFVGIFTGAALTPSSMSGIGLITPPIIYAGATLGGMLSAKSIYLLLSCPEKNSGRN